MSIRLMSKVWGLAVDAETRDILMALADHADDNGNGVRPSIGRLAWKIGKGIKNKNGEYPESRTVQRRVKELLKCQALTLVRKSGYKRANEYHLDLSVFPEKPEFEDKGDNLSFLSKGDKLDEMGDKMTNKGDTYLSPEPSLESSIKPSDEIQFVTPEPREPLTSEQAKASVAKTLASHALGKKAGVSDAHKGKEHDIVRLAALIASAREQQSLPDDLFENERSGYAFPYRKAAEGIYTDIKKNPDKLNIQAILSSRSYFLGDGGAKYRNQNYSYSAATIASEIVQFFLSQSRQVLSQSETVNESSELPTVDMSKVTIQYG